MIEIPASVDASGARTAPTDGAANAGMVATVIAMGGERVAKTNA